MSRCQDPNLVFPVCCKWLRRYLPFLTPSFFPSSSTHCRIVILLFSDKTQGPPWERPQVLAATTLRLSCIWWAFFLSAFSLAHVDERPLDLRSQKRPCLSTSRISSHPFSEKLAACWRASNKVKILKSVREKRHRWLITDFPNETAEARRQRNIFKALKEKNYLVEVHRSTNILPKSRGNKNAFRKTKFDKSHHQLTCTKENIKGCSFDRRKINSNVTLEMKEWMKNNIKGKDICKCKWILTMYKMIVSCGVENI